MDLIPIHGAELHYDPHFLDPEEATELFNTLLTKCAWTRHKASFGHAVPRDEAYYGDPGTQYTYSRRQYKPFLDTGIALAESPRRRVHSSCGLCQFVLAEDWIQRRTLQSVSGWK